MKRISLVVFLFSLCTLNSLAQVKNNNMPGDTVYARQVIKKLTSKDFYGRGYLNNGLDKAAKYISSELKRLKAKPLFSTGYFQWFDFNVNTFPDKVMVKVNNKLLKPGEDYIIAPESSGLKGSFELTKLDSNNYFVKPKNGLVPKLEKPNPLVEWLEAPQNGTQQPEKDIKIGVQLKRKLTFSASQYAADYCLIELLNKNQYNDIKKVEVNIENKVLTKYINKNVCAYIDGTTNNDTVIVFSAHYDHLGGMGKKVYFPGANDNASGVSVLLNLVKWYANNPPKYKTVFIFFAGEEIGLLGSEYFVKNKTIDLTKIKFLINLDLLGTGNDGIMVTNGYLHEKEFKKLEQINKDQNLLKEIKRRGKARNSDHYWFTEAGVPSFFIYTLGGIKAYHDIYDVEKTLPLTDYVDACKLITEFVKIL